MHLKCVLLEGCVAYVGSANWTAHSKKNWELVVRL